MKYRWEHNLLECYYWKGIKVNKMLLRKTKYYKSTYKTWRWREKAIEILALYLRARLQRTKEPKPFVSIQLNKFKGEGWMDFYLTINSRLVREKHWYKDINRLPYGNLTGKNESMKRHQKTHNSPERSSYASVVFCGMYPCLSLKKKTKKQNVVSLLSFCSYQVDDTLNFPADKNFVQLQSVLPRSMRLKVPRCRVFWL